MPTLTGSRRVRAALRYAALGWRVLPLTPRQRRRVRPPFTLLRRLGHVRVGRPRERTPSAG